MKTKSGKKSDAPDLPIFHPMIVMNWALVLLLITSGCAIAYSATGYRLVGVILAIIGLVIVTMGWRHHKPDSPRQAGVLTFLHSIVTWKEVPVVVGGDVVVIPFLMDTIVVNTDNEDYKIPITVISKEDKVNGISKASIPGEVILTVRVDTDDIADFIQSGNEVKKVVELIQGSAIATIKEVAKEKTVYEICQDGETMNRELKDKMDNDLFSRKKVGLKLVIVKCNFTLPKHIEAKLNEAAGESAERVKDKADSQTMTEMAKAMQYEAAMKHIPSYRGMKVDSLKDGDRKIIEDEIYRDGGLLARKLVDKFSLYEERAERRRLINQGQVTKIEGAGNTLNLANLNTSNKTP